MPDTKDTKQSMYINPVSHLNQALADAMKTMEEAATRGDEMLDMEAIMSSIHEAASKDSESIDKRINYLEERYHEKYQIFCQELKLKTLRSQLKEIKKEQPETAEKLEKIQQIENAIQETSEKIQTMRREISDSKISDDEMMVVVVCVIRRKMERGKEMSKHEVIEAITQLIEATKIYRLKTTVAIDMQIEYIQNIKKVIEGKLEIDSEEAKPIQKNIDDYNEIARLQGQPNINSIGLAQIKVQSLIDCMTERHILGISEIEFFRYSPKIYEPEKLRKELDEAWTRYRQKCSATNSQEYAMQDIEKLILYHKHLSAIKKKTTFPHEKHNILYFEGKFLHNPIVQELYNYLPLAKSVLTMPEQDKSSERDTSNTSKSETDTLTKTIHYPEKYSKQIPDHYESSEECITCINKYIEEFAEHIEKFVEEFAAHNKSVEKSAKKINQDVEASAEYELYKDTYAVLAEHIHEYVEELAQEMHKSVEQLAQDIKKASTEEFAKHIRQSEANNKSVEEFAEHIRQDVEEFKKHMHSAAKEFVEKFYDYEKLLCDYRSPKKFAAHITDDLKKELQDKYPKKLQNLNSKKRGNIENVKIILQIKYTTTREEIDHPPICIESKTLDLDTILTELKSHIEESATKYFHPTYNVMSITASINLAVSLEPKSVELPTKSNMNDSNPSIIEDLEAEVEDIEVKLQACQEKYTEKKQELDNIAEQLKQKTQYYDSWDQRVEAQCQFNVFDYTDSPVENALRYSTSKINAEVKNSINGLVNEYEAKASEPIKLREEIYDLQEKLNNTKEQLNNLMAKLNLQEEYEEPAPKKKRLDNAVGSTFKREPNETPMITD